MPFYTNPTQVRFKWNNEDQYGIAFRDYVISSEGIPYQIKDIVENSKLNLDCTIIELSWINLKI